MAAESFDQLDLAALESNVYQKGIEFTGEPEMVDFGFCAICLDKILLQETAIVKGCEHAYCVTCILRWASYKDKPSCPQCKHPFESLNIHRSLDGCIHDYMFEESVCLLLRAPWFIPIVTEPQPDEPDDLSQFYTEQSELGELYFEEDDLDGPYYSSMPGGASSSSMSKIRICNRRWGDNGFVRAGHQQARPVRISEQLFYLDEECEFVSRRPVRNNKNHKSIGNNKKDKEKQEGEGSGSGTSNDSTGGLEENKEKKEGEGSGSGSGAPKDLIGRRAKRAMKREAADRAAAEKHQQLLKRLGRV